MAVLKLLICHVERDYLCITSFYHAVIHEPKGPTPNSQFEHSSVPATVKRLFNLNSNYLTKRDAWAGTFESYFSLRKTPRTDCPGNAILYVELIQLASQLNGDHVLNTYPDIGKGMTVGQANRYAEDAVARLLEAGRAALRAGANESAIVTMRPALTSRTKEGEPNLRSESFRPSRPRPSVGISFDSPPATGPPWSKCALTVVEVGDRDAHRVGDADANLLRGSLPLARYGFRSFVWTAVSFQMKDILKLSPSASQFVVSVAHSPWSIKPIYGILSDCIPISGRRRLPYLVISTILSLIPWLILGLANSLRSSRNTLTAFLTLQNLGSAMADVVVDAMIAEAVRSELYVEFTWLCCF
ncbi:hypothetical protein GW17_00024408 [Ensete ventricosum]|nr:hypothetical protein GW17_00024408 [Ensete ventricosum]